MKTNKFKLYAGLIATVCISLTACSEDEKATSTVDGSPIAFTASINTPTIRITDNQWEENEKVAIAIDGETEYRTYTIGVENQMTSDHPYTWDGTQHSVKAWSPILTEAKDISDQSADDKFFACDFLTCETSIQTKNVKLQFSHAMTRAWYELQVADAYTEDDIKNATIEFYGYPKAKFNNGTLVGEGEMTAITTRKAKDNFRDGEAFLVPTEMWNQPLIKVTIGGNTYTYTPSNSDPESEDVKKKRGILLPGQWQRYYLKITETGLEVTMMSSVAWGTKEDVPSDAIDNGKFHAAISTDITSKPGYTTTDFDRGNITGESFSVTYTESSTGGVLCEGKCDVKRTTSGTSQTYTFSKIRSDLSLSYVDEYVAVGDYFYSDGTWGTDISKDGTTTVGTVFKVGIGKGDTPGYYGFTKIRGYVAALSVTQDTYKWIINSAGNDNASAQLLKTLGELDGERNSQELYNGYTLTKSLLTLIAESKSDFPIFDQLSGEDWSPIVAGEKSYSWYLPSYAQFKEIVGSGKFSLSNSYWTSTNFVDKDADGNVTRVWALRFNTNDTSNSWADDPLKFLPILTF